ERIHRIVRDLLHFARPKPATSADELPSASIRSALDETLGLLEPQPSWRDITAKTELAEHLPLVVASHEALVQIFLNLLLNAAAACYPSGTVRISAALSNSPSGSAGQGDMQFVEVSVEDD